jgi:hypothetical protein
MNDALAGQYGTRPRQHLADGGFAKLDDIEALAQNGVETFVPVAARASICGTQKSIAITVCSLASISAVGMADWLPLQHRQSGEHQAALHPGGMPQS